MPTPWNFLTGRHCFQVVNQPRLAGNEIPFGGTRLGYQKSIKNSRPLKNRAQLYFRAKKNQQYQNWKYIIKRLYYTPCSFQSAAAFVLTTLWPGRCMPCSSVWYTMGLKAIWSRSAIYKSGLSLTKLFTGSDTKFQISFLRIFMYMSQGL